MSDMDTIGGTLSSPRRRLRSTTALVLVVLSLVVPAAVVSAGAPSSRGDAVQEPAAPAKKDTTKPSRGAAQQVTPTLPPPTTTTTLPPVPAWSGEGRRVVYSIGMQRVWAIETNGKLAKTHAVSGRIGMPTPGVYSVFSRSLVTHSLKNPRITWMYMVRFAKGPSNDNIGFHEIPTECNAEGRCWKLQSEAQLGQPLSGGCVRQSTADAIWMWNWAQLGTTVVVVP